MGGGGTQVGVRRRTVAVGLAIGVLIGAVVSSVVRSPAAVRSAGVTRLPVMVLDGPVLVDPHDPEPLRVSTYCRDVQAPACTVVAAQVHVRSLGTPDWIALDARDVDRAFEVVVPADVVGAEGFEYWVSASTGTGAVLTYPAAASAAPLRVATIAGLRVLALPDRPLRNLDAPDRTVLRAPYGAGPGEVGRLLPEGDGLPAGPSSMAVGPDGSIYLDDWVNERIARFGSDGAWIGSVPAPGVAADLAVGPDGGFALAEVFLGGRVFRLAPDGAIRGVELTTQGLPSSIEPTPAGPAVFLGSGQWELGTWSGQEPERGRPLVPAPPALTGGPVVVDVLPRDRFAVRWSAPDGSPTGAVVALPPGVSSGPTFLARALPDGGALVVRNLTTARYNSYAAIRFGVDGRIAGVTLIRRTTLEQNAHLSTVRFLPPHEVLSVYANERGLRVDAYEVR